MASDKTGLLFETPAHMSGVTGRSAADDSCSSSERFQEIAQIANHVVMETIDSHRPPICICLIRHGLSTANVDEKIYTQMPDHTIPLVNPVDDPVLLQAGEGLASLGIPPNDTVAWYSPYLRTKQTMETVLAAAFGDQAHLVQKRESFLLREQEFGDWNTLSALEMERENPRRFVALKQAKDVYNKFYFRYPNGESRADVAQRVTLFTSKFFRGSKQHHIVFLHGVTQRALRMTFFNRTVEWFEREPNPLNGSVIHMKRNLEKVHGPRWSEYYLYDGQGRFVSPMMNDDAAESDVESD